MRRVLVAMLVPAMLVLSAAPALAQQTDEQPPDGTEPAKSDYVEPSEPAYALYVNDYSITVDGEETKVFIAGSDGRLRVTIYNGGEQRARDIALRLRSDNASLEVLEGRDSIPDLAPGESARASFLVRAHERDCVGDGAILMKMTSSLGEREEYVAGQVLCPGPNVYPGEIRYEGGDGDNVPEPGERLKVFVDLANFGRDTATAVTARIRIDHPDVTVIERTASWPDIARDHSEGPSAPFVIQIASDAKVQEDSCGGGGGARGEPVPVEDGDQSVSSDGDQTVSSDGEPGSGGGSVAGDDGSTGSTPAGGGSDPNTGTEPAGRPEPAPAPEEPAYVEPDPAVAFEAVMTITASGGEFESGFGTLQYCMLESQGRPSDGSAARGGAVPDALPVAGEGDDTGLVAQRGTGRTSAAAAAAVLLALVGGAMLLRGRFSTR